MKDPKIYSALSTLFKEQTEKKHALLLKKDLLISELRKLQNHLSLQSTILSSDSLYTGKEYPIILGNASTRMSVLELGRLPHKSEKTNFNAMYIYPIGYKAKRKYKRHNDCIKKSLDDKMFYLCSINLNEMCIQCFCGRNFKGTIEEKEKIWEEFRNETLDGEVENIDEFFGLSHTGLVKIIEEMGDLKGLDGYVMISNR